MQTTNLGDDEAGENYEGAEHLAGGEGLGEDQPAQRGGHHRAEQTEEGDLGEGSACRP